VKYAVIRQHVGEFPVRLMCRVLEVTPSGYYAWKRRPTSLWERNRRQLGELVKVLFDRNRQVYGSPRLTDELRDAGYRHSKNYVARIMKEQQLEAKTVKRFRRTTDSAHKRRIYPNRLKRDFTVLQPNKAWVSDITYVWTQEGWLYLCVFLDLYSRKVVGWCLKSELTEGLVLDAFEMAIAQREPNPGLIVHSDRGVQYTANKYRKLLIRRGFLGSMSRRGDCWDNAVAESFFGTLKREHIAFRRYATRNTARTDIFEYIEVFYNRQRRHSTNGNVSPVQFELAA